MSRRSLSTLIASMLLGVLLMLGAVCIPAGAESFCEFPEGVIVVPQGTSIAIDDDAGTVTIRNCPVALSAGDTFVVYLQELPIGYVATGITVQDGETIVSAVRADNALYANLEGEYNVELTPDMYEFIPAEGVTVIERGLGYSDGKLTMSASGGGASVQAYLSGLSLSNSSSNGSISVSLSGNWGISTSMTATGGELADVSLGKIRVMGVGYFDIRISLACTIENGIDIHGTFRAGFTVHQDGTASITKDFSASGTTYKNKGSLSASLSVSAGVDVLVAMADVHVEIGAVTEISTETHKDCCSCTDYCIFLYSSVGAVAKYFSIDEMQMVPVEGKGFEPLDINWKPVELRAHFCDGEWVSQCHHGNRVPSRDSMGSVSYSFGSTLLEGDRARITEDEIRLPWDTVIDGDYTLAHGTLNLNGHSLIVNGDLIHTDGKLVIGGGSLTVNGDYRIQGELTLQNEVIAYADSTASLIMQDAGDIVTVTGDLILQSTSEEHRVSRGVFNLRGDIYQYETATGAGSFKTGSDCNFILTSPNAHVLSFEDAVNNHIGWLTFNNHVSAPKSLSIGRVDMNGYNLTVAGNLTTTGQVNLQDFDPAPPVYTPSGDLTLSGDMTVESDTLYKGMNLGGYSLTVNGDMRCTSSIDLNCGTLTIKGTLYHESGEIYVHGGKLIITGNYYIAGSDSNFTPGNQTFTTSWGRLVMKHEADEVHIGGNFLTASYYSSKSYTFLTNGTMYIAGNFRHALGDQYGFNATENHRVVFNGSAPQSIQFASTGSGFANVEFVNPDIILKGEYLRGFTLQNDINLTIESNLLYFCDPMDLNGHTIGDGQVDGDFVFSDNSSINVDDGTLIMNGQDLTFNGNLTLYDEINLSGQNLTVNGDLRIYSTMWLQGGTLTVNGNLYHSDDWLYMNGGTIHVTGNMTAGPLNSTIHFAHILMTNDDDVLRVDGDFTSISTRYSYSAYTAGTMYIGGNFRQIRSDSQDESDSFLSTDKHQVVFCGTGTQTIHFDNAYSGFTNVRFENPNIELKGTQLRGFVLQDDINLTISTDMLEIHGTMDLNGHSIGSGVIDSNFTMTGGTLKLSGQTLTINGNLYQQDSYLKIGGGKLIVTGNYYITGAGSSYTPGAESYTYSSSVLYMQSVDDEVRIAGDFINASWFNHGSYLTNGTLYIGGNLRQLSVGAESSFATSGSHTTVFNGTSTQTIHFGSNKSGFTNVRFENPDIELKGTQLRGFVLQDDINLTLSTDTLEIAGTMDLNGHSIGLEEIDGGFTLTDCDSQAGEDVLILSDDLTVSGDVTLGAEIRLAGNTLVIDGNLTLDQSMNLQSGKLTVHGNLHHTNGILRINGGTLTVHGNYWCVGEDSEFVPGSETYTQSWGTLQMIHETDVMRVYGDFVTYNTYAAGYLTNGTIYLYGDFREIYNSFVTSGNHTTVFNGPSTQTIHFDSIKSGFTNVRFENPDIELKGTQLRGFVLQDDINLTLSTDTLEIAGTMDLNGHSIGLEEIDGDFTLTGDGTLDMDGMSLRVDGDLNLSAELNLAGQTLIVTDDMIFGGQADLNGGTLKVKGSLYQQGGSMNVNCGKLHVSDSYCIAGPASSFVPGAEYYEAVSATLQMNRPEDEVRIGGDFITAASYSGTLSDGVMYISGDFRQVTSSRNFQPWGNHLVVLNGADRQSVSFAAEGCRFETLQIIRMRPNYDFTPDPCWDKLIEPEATPIELPASLTAIEAGAFAGDPGLIIVDLRGTSLHTIGSGAFRDCTNLLRVYIPAGVTLIAPDAFEGCDALTICCEEGSAAQQFADAQGIPWATP